MPAPEPVLVFVHVHYPDIWRDMAAALALRLNTPFRLVATTSHPAGSVAVPDTPFLLGHRVMEVENRGRDILPFLRALAETEGFGIGLKLHTKKSPQRQDGGQWRAEVLESLVPSGLDPSGAPWAGTGAEALVRRIAADARIGLVAPAGFALSVRPWVLVNRPGMERVMEAAGAPLRDADMDGAVFAAGSMFWFRRHAVASLAQPAVLALFEPEQGQFDGTAAHAAERLFPVAARRAGLVSLSVDALEASRPSMTDAALAALALRRADIPTTYFPAPTPPPPEPEPLPAAAPPPPRRWFSRR